MTMTALWRAAFASAWRYAGVFAMTFGLQLILASAAGFIVAQMLGATFARAPYFDMAIDGDVTAWLHLLGAHLAVFRDLLWIPMAMVLLWVMISWFLRGGILRVYAAEPEDRIGTALAFSRGGVLNFWPFARLGILSWILYSSLIFPMLGLGISLVQGNLMQAMTPLSWTAYLLLGIAPAMLLAFVVDTATSIASVMLNAGPDDLPKRSWATFAFALSFVFARPRLLLFAALGWGMIIAISAASFAIAFDKPMLGAQGALILWFLRTATSGARHFIKLTVMAGQTEALTKR